MRISYDEVHDEMFYLSYFRVFYMLKCEVTHTATWYFYLQVLKFRKYLLYRIVIHE